MTCPQCNNEFPEDQKGKRCPYCGWRAWRFNWLIFLCALLLPPLLTLVSAATMRSILAKPTNEDFSTQIALFGGGTGGIICGITIAFGITKRIPPRVALSIILSAVMIVVCVTLCLVGCTAGGYQFRIGE